ncbi:site-2 protease family protein [Halomarina oriensis]|uniref:Site-2 protease family protein n=1 Tax=Halomarina oriensis TaxID=671145 RepID=A0A6B0GFF8_9EURY|nr:site-2 protease family protein [Halomarina oriensis]MWG33686.1 site-2 protease family protein [Halomarina oriensis]
MDEFEEPRAGPPIYALRSVFRVYETHREGDRLLYYGDPIVSPDVLERHVWPLFRDAGYEVTLQVRTGEHVLVAEPRSTGLDGVPWKNVVFALLTVVTTLFAGVEWYGATVSLDDPLSVLQTWPFAAAVLGVLGIHELGHYVMSRHHDVNATLPYFIPVPTIFGTMGAVIKMKGRIPDRKALFDIGVAGPLAGLAAAIVVTAIGLQLEPVAAGPVYGIGELNYPPLIRFIAASTGADLNPPGARVNPVVVGGWVGMFVTFLNLLPVGQLDGGHLVRAMLGERQETVAAMVPAGLFGLGGYLLLVQEVELQAITLWFFWGLIAIGLAYAGPATPVLDDELGARRMAVGVLTFVLGLLCFTPVPFTFVI